MYTVGAVRPGRPVRRVHAEGDRRAGPTATGLGVAGRLLALQQVAGNGAVTQLVQRRPAGHTLSGADRRDMPAESEAAALRAELATLQQRVNIGEKLSDEEQQRLTELRRKVHLRTLGDDEKTLAINRRPGLDAWFDEVKPVDVFGQKVVVHKELGDRLKVAEADLKDEPPPKNGWMDKTVSTLRGAGEGLHAFGLAIDIYPLLNPYLRDPAAGAKESNSANAAVKATVERAILLVCGRTAADLAWLERPAVPDGDQRVEASYDKLAEASSALKEYFTLVKPDKRAALEKLVERARPMDPEKRTVKEWVVKIGKDRQYIGNIARAIRWSRPEEGFLHIDKRLVKALTRTGGAGLTWLGDDKIAGGRDIMHFDTRAVGPIHRIWSSAEGRAIWLGNG